MWLWHAVAATLQKDVVKARDGAGDQRAAGPGGSGELCSARDFTHCDERLGEVKVP